MKLKNKHLGVTILVILLTLAATSMSAQSILPNPKVKNDPNPENTKPDTETETTTSNLPAKNLFALNLDAKSKSHPEDPTSFSNTLAKTKKQASSDDWHFAFAPYLYATGISGTVGARGRTVVVDASFGKVLDNLNFGLMGTLEAKKGKFIMFSDLIWTKMSKERNTPGGLYNTAKLDMNLFIFDPEIGYRLYESDGGSFDVLGGIRIWSVENKLNLTTGTLPGFNVQERKTWAAPVAGIHGVANVSKAVFLSTKFDIGAGFGTEFTTQFYGGGGLRLSPKTSLIAGYRFLKVDRHDNAGFIFDTQMNGFVFGAKFAF